MAWAGLNGRACAALPTNVAKFTALACGPGCPRRIHAAPSPLPRARSVPPGPTHSTRDPMQRIVKAACRRVTPGTPSQRRHGRPAPPAAAAHVIVGRPCQAAPRFQQHFDHRRMPVYGHMSWSAHWHSFYYGDREYRCCHGRSLSGLRFLGHSGRQGSAQCPHRSTVTPPGCHHSKTASI